LAGIKKYWGEGNLFLPIPLPLGISEGKGEELKEGLAPLLDAPLWWGRVKLRDKQQMILGGQGGNR